MWRFLVNIGTLFLVYVAARFTLGLGGIVADHAAPDQLMASLTVVAIASQVLFWVFTRGKQWGGIHLMNGLMTIIITIVGVFAFLRYVGLYQVDAGPVGTGLIMLGLGFILVAKVITMLLLLLGVLNRVGTDPGGNPSQEQVDADV